jgi:hypothetical protein
MGLGTVCEMWDHLRQRYHPYGGSLLDSTIDELYTQLLFGVNLTASTEARAPRN